MTDRTMLARLGFQDKDRKTPEHQAAMLLLISEPEVLARALGKYHDISMCKCDPERPLSKGHAQYKTTIGFLDGFVTFSAWKDGDKRRAIGPFLAKCTTCDHVEAFESRDAISDHHQVRAIYRFPKCNKPESNNMLDCVCRSSIPECPPTKMLHMKCGGRTYCQCSREVPYCYEEMNSSHYSKFEKLEYTGETADPDPYRNEVVVEIKSAIDDLGEVLRQCNLYRTYLEQDYEMRYASFVIWSVRESDVQYEAALANSGYILLVGKIPKLPCALLPRGLSRLSKYKGTST